MTTEEELLAVASYDEELIDFLLFGEKTCRHCGTVKPACTTYFFKDRSKDDELNLLCKDCRSAIEKAWRLEHPEAFAAKKARMRERYARRQAAGDAA